MMSHWYGFYGPGSAPISPRVANATKHPVVTHTTKPEWSAPHTFGYSVSYVFGQTRRNEPNGDVYEAISPNITLVCQIPSGYRKIMYRRSGGMGCTVDRTI